MDLSYAFSLPALLSAFAFSISNSEMRVNKHLSFDSNILTLLISSSNTGKSGLIKRILNTLNETRQNIAEPNINSILINPAIDQIQKAFQFFL